MERDVNQYEVVISLRSSSDGTAGWDKEKIQFCQSTWGWGYEEIGKLAPNKEQNMDVKGEKVQSCEWEHYKRSVRRRASLN